MTDTTAAKGPRSLSLGTRIFLVTSLLIALAVGVAVAVTSLLIGDIARNAVRESLRSSASMQDMFRAQRYEQLKLIARLFVEDPALNAYVAEAGDRRDVRSILDLLSSRRGDLGFDFAIVLDPSGQVIARTDDPSATGQNLARRTLVSAAVSNLRESSGVWQEGDSLYYAVAVPIAKSFELHGFLVTGYRITDSLARDVNAVSGTDIAFVSNRDTEPRVVATTLNPAMEKSLPGALHSAGIDAAIRRGREVSEANLALGGEPWVAEAAPLRDAGGKPVGGTVALVPLGKQLEAYRRIQLALLLSGLASILIGPALSLVFARSTLAPVRRLAASAEAARQGNFDQPIQVGRNDEVGTLARAFDELLGDLREKRDMEAYMSELSRTLPEPAPARGALGVPVSQETVLLAVELHGYSRPGGDAGPQQTLDRLGRELEHLERAVTSAGGQVVALAGHRVLARFDGARRAPRALAAASQLLLLPAAWGEEAGAEAPSLALASGTVVSGPVSWGEQADRTVVGLPVQQLESLLREATPGELVLSRSVYEALKEVFVQSGYQLAPRRGVVSPQPLYILSAEVAGRLAASPEQARALERESDEAPLPTLSGLAPGAVMAHRFQILAVLGAGGMGVVYKARDRELDDLVALKMLKRELWGDRGQLERLKSEIKLARKITHPNVLRTYDFGEIDGVPYISMEYVRGVTLRYLLDQAHRLPYSAGLRLAKQLCAGLGAAHEMGVIHRDIKPENLLLEPTGNLKLMDFGIARPVGRPLGDQTQAGFVIGTPQYLAPEQLQGEEVDTRADIYACGVVLYEVFTGKLPFEAATAMEVMVKHLREEPARPSSLWPEIPERLEGCILRCLRKSRGERFGSVRELLHELETLSA